MVPSAIRSSPAETPRAMKAQKLRSPLDTPGRLPPVSGGDPPAVDGDGGPSAAVASGPEEVWPLPLRRALEANEVAADQQQCLAVRVAEFEVGVVGDASREEPPLAPELALEGHLRNCRVREL